MTEIYGITLEPVTTTLFRACLFFRVKKKHERVITAIILHISKKKTITLNGHEIYTPPVPCTFF